jgi:putative ABC transport system permease protein
VPILRDLSIAEVPGAAGARLDAQTLAIGAAAGLVTAIVCGLAPLVMLGRLNPATVLGAHARGSSGGRRHAAFRGAIVAAQVTFAAVLLTGAGLMLRTLARLTSVDPGFRSERVLTFDVTLPGSRYQEHAARIGFFRAFVERTAALPGVIAVGANRYFPLRDRQFSNPIFVEGRPVAPGREPIVQYGGITSGYFQAMGIPLLAGRDFTQREMWDEPGAVIVNQALAHLLWPGEDPLGRRLKHGADQPWLTVVGVVADVRQRRIDEPPYPQIYVPYADYKHTTMSVAVRTASDPEGLLAPVRDVVRTLDPQLPLFNVMTLDEAVARGIGGRRSAGVLLTLFAAVALAMAVVGIYGVTAYTVRQQKRDLAIRVALGATRADVIRHVLRGGSAALVAGAAVGLFVAAMLSRSLSAVLFEVDPLDPLVVSGATAALIAAGLLAGYLPARRAARTDAAAALKISHPKGVLQDEKYVEIYRSLRDDYGRSFGKAEPSHGYRSAVFDRAIHAFIQAQPNAAGIRTHDSSRPPEAIHPTRRAVPGSSSSAVLAGPIAARAARPRATATATIIDQASSAVTPAITRVRTSADAAAPSTPRPAPAIASIIASPTTCIITWCGAAPRARRRPVSRVRWLTRYTSNA